MLVRKGREKRRNGGDGKRKIGTDWSITLKEEGEAREKPLNKSKREIKNK